MVQADLVKEEEGKRYNLLEKENNLSNKPETSILPGEGGK